MTISNSLVLCVFVSISTCLSKTFTVTNTEADGINSFSWAIKQTESNPGPDTVLFVIPKNAPEFNGDFWTIKLNEPIVTLSDGNTFIDGFSQSNKIENTNPTGPEILLDGSLCPQSPGIKITSQQNTICGLAIGGFSGTGIMISGTKAQFNTIFGCFIGTNAKGTDDFGNSASGIALLNYSNHNNIGIKDSPFPNLLSGNDMYGLLVEQSSQNTILGNFIGTDITGLKAIPNGAEPKKYAGIHITINSKNNIVGDGTKDGKNIISGNYRTGIRIENTGADSNIIKGNFIGLGIDGRTRIPNGEAGLLIGRGASYNLIGGIESGAENVISGNHSSGIQLARGCYYNTIQGNLIGTGSSGIIIIPNDHNGIYFYGNNQDGFPQYNTIGPDNIICGNGNAPFSEFWGGISIDNSGTSHNIISNNYIGVNPHTNLQAGQPTGILIQRGAHSNIIGPGNTITNSAVNGVLVMHDSTTFNTITQNRIFNNQGKAIANLLGGNAELPPPKILYADPSTVAGTSVSGSIVEFYASQNGQAKIYLGKSQTNQNGSFEWNSQLSNPHIVALAIDEHGNTSELSTSRLVPVEIASLQVVCIAPLRNRLTWKTITESNNLGFVIQRRTSDGKFSEIAFINGHGTTGSEFYYEYIDSLSQPGTFLYRLKQVDLDGKTWFSKEISVENSLNNENPLNIYPNPFNDQTRISFYSFKNQKMCIDIYNIKGEKIFTLFEGFVQTGWTEKHWNGQMKNNATAPSGVYLIVMRSQKAIHMQKCLMVH